jgi:probable rRNA maturation factor
VITLDVVVEGGDWVRIGDMEAIAQRSAAAAAAVGRADMPLAATLLLADDMAVRELNRAWRGQDKPTNVLSFPANAPTIPGEPRYLGDLALAFETLVREADDEGKSVADHAAHLVVHGVLHLLGRDHETDAEADEMERLEIEALAAIGIADPYGDDAR